MFLAYNAGMALTCNIDSRGRAARLIWGLLLIALGGVLLVGWAWGTESWLRWVLSILSILAGGFAVFEARAGWCVVRALGMKTPL